MPAMRKSKFIRAMLALSATIVFTGMVSSAVYSRQAAPPAKAKPGAQNASARGTATSGVINDPRLDDLDSIIEQSIAKDEIPGGVLLVGSHGRIVWRKAYGSRAILPKREAMTPDTIFDLASLTKV